MAMTEKEMYILSRLKYARAFVVKKCEEAELEEEEIEAGEVCRKLDEAISQLEPPLQFPNF